VGAVGPEPQQVWATAVCRPSLAVSYLGSLTEFDTGEAGAGDSCPSPPTPATSISGMGGEVQGGGSTVRISAVVPMDNTIEAGTVPDDGVLLQAQNFSPSAGDEYGPFGACLALAP
jgi:hypothetical protein